MARSFARAHPDVRRVVVADIPKPYRLAGVDLLPYRVFLARLGRWLR